MDYFKNRLKLYRLLKRKNNVSYCKFKSKNRTKIARDIGLKKQSLLEKRRAARF